ncbi:MAG: glycosyl hydrolase, partial [Proteobacteria bacterium]
SGLVDDRSIVSDKLINCVKENMSPAWTYNQGIILGAAVELHKATGNVGYLDQAKKTAYGAMQYVTSGGILIEATDSSCGACTGDERLFKGAFMRNLREFYGARKDETIGNFLRNNANSAYNKARTSDNYYGFRWNGPYDRKDAGRQTSALDLMNAMIVL